MISMDDPNVYSRVEEYRFENKSGKVNWIMTKGLGLGTKILVTGLLVSSAPIVLPPLLVISAIGVAFSVPYGVMLASYACTEKIMSKLLPRPAASPQLKTLYDYYDELGSYEFQGGQGMEYQRNVNMEEIEKSYIEEARDEVAMRNALVVEGIDECGEGNATIQKDNRKENDENKVEYEYDSEIRHDDIERKEDMEEEPVMNFERGEEEARLDDMQEEFEMRDKLGEEGIKKQNESNNLIAVEYGQSAVNQPTTLERSISENENEIEYGKYLEKDEEKLCEEIDMKIERVMYEEQEEEPLMRKSKPEQKVDDASSIYINVDTYDKPDTDNKGEYTAYEVTNIIAVALDQASNTYAWDGERDKIDLSHEKYESYGNSPKGGHESNHDRMSSGRDTDMPSNEVAYDEKKIWEQINAMRTIVGYKAQKHASYIEELKALYVFTGVEPPALFQESSDLMEVADKVQFLMSIVGVKQ